MQIHLRRMTVEDIPAVHALDELCFALVWPENSYIYDLTQNPNARFYVAVVDDPSSSEKIVGILGMWLVVDEAHIGTVAVHPQWRKQGIARTMLIRALREAKELGMITAELEVRRGNLPAQALYGGLGFLVVGERPHYYADNGEDALLLTLPDIQRALENQGKQA